MDETEFKATYDQVNHRPCVFAKAILTRCAGCSRSQRLFIAEREAVACRSQGGWQRCHTLNSLLHQNALFALRLTHMEDKLPHGKELKVQCGGLHGVAAVAGDGHAIPAPSDDIYPLLEQAQARFGSLEQLPFPEVIKWVVAHQGRKRHKTGP